MRFLILWVSVALVGCSDEPHSQTVADAIRFGYMSLSCDAVEPGPIFADSVRYELEDATCAGVRQAITAITQWEHDPTEGSGLDPDSISAIIVAHREYAATTQRPSTAYLMITVELLHRDQNLVVTLPGVDGALEIGWVPQGLRY